MERVNRILYHAEYQEYVRKNEEAESKRRFCLHNMGHFLDVCRLALLLYYRKPLAEEGAEIKEDMIYAAGLLHDIGRWMQYETGTPHEEAGSLLAVGILKDCGYNEAETEEIVAAIANHRNRNIENEHSLSGLLYRADKMSRSCFACKAEPECNWDENKKNLQIRL